MSDRMIRRRKERGEGKLRVQGKWMGDETLLDCWAFIYKGATNTYAFYAISFSIEEGGNDHNKEYDELGIELSWVCMRFEGGDSTV